MNSRLSNRLKGLTRLGSACVSLLLLTFPLAACQDASTANPSASQAPANAAAQPAHQNLKTIDFILDWTPNTNHTGLYVAQAKGYLAEEGLQLDIKRPPEGSTSDLIINNQAPFGVYFQDFLANKLAKGAPVVAVAAIIEHNTSGILSTQAAQIQKPVDLVGKRYGTWQDPLELAMVKHLVERENGDYGRVELVPNADSNSIAPMINNQFDAAWVYYGWDGFLAESLGLQTNFFYFKDFAPELDYYSPIIISNETYLKDHPEEAKKVIRAIKKGYQYAIEHPDEAAEILIAQAPELASKKDFVLASQRYLSQHYASDPAQWGHLDAKRWNAYYQWVNDQKLSEKPVPLDKGFTNDYLGE